MNNNRFDFFLFNSSHSSVCPSPLQTRQWDKAIALDLGHVLQLVVGPPPPPSHTCYVRRLEFYFTCRPRFAVNDSPLDLMLMLVLVIHWYQWNVDCFTTNSLDLISMKITTWKPFCSSKSWIHPRHATFPLDHPSRHAAIQPTPLHTPCKLSPHPHCNHRQEGTFSFLAIQRRSSLSLSSLETSRFKQHGFPFQLTRLKVGGNILDRLVQKPTRLTPLISKAWLWQWFFLGLIYVVWKPQVLMFL